MSNLRLFWMVLRLAALLGYGIWRLRAFPRLNAQERRIEVQRWSLGMLRAVRTRLDVRGEPHAGACLLAVNHVSWVDVMALNAAHPTRFVSKADVRHWPLLGRLAHDAGTLFIERERPRDAMRVMHDMARCLREGQHVSVFPEGTTSDGSRILPLHANLFQAAVSADCPVQPVLLRYVDAATGAPSRAAAYIGNDTLLDTLGRLSSDDPVRVEVHYLPVIYGNERRAIAAAVEDALREALGQADPAPGAQG